jgi:hypothetical protein
MSATEKIAEKTNNVEKKEKTLKSAGEKVFSKLSDIESNLAILKSELFSLSPEELIKFQALKKAKSADKENLSILQTRLIKTIKDGDEEFIRALANVVNGFVLLRKNAVTERKD